MSSISDEIAKLKKEKNAVILAHNYQRPEVQVIADILGDSLALSIEASKTRADVVVFCGVDFMAESAKILSPDKIVILPNRRAKCPMSAMADAEGVELMKKEHPDAVVVSYVNTSAAVKAVTDVCCTSANAVKVVSGLKEKEIIFVPDTNLGSYVQSQLPDKQIHLWPGYCPTHDLITRDDILRLKKEHPDAGVLAHPECTSEVLEIASGVFSTEGMIKHAVKSEAKEFIMATEKELGYRLEKEAPGKKFYFVSYAVCPTMKIISLEDVRNSLRDLTPRIELDAKTIRNARAPLDRMIQAGR